VDQPAANESIIPPIC